VKGLAEMSPKIHFHDEEKLKKINTETMKLWKKYEVDMALRELSPNTVAGYKNDIEHWLIYIYDNQGNQCITDLEEDDITEFLYYCKKGGNNSRRMKRRMASISAFYKYLRKKRIIQENPMEFIDRPKKDMDVITQTFLNKEQVDAMRKYLSEQQDRLLELYAFFSLSTMARVTAVSNTRWEQIDFENRIVTDVIEKEGYLVTLYFSEEVKEMLLSIRDEREITHIDDGGYVFFSDNDGKIGPISTGALNQWCKKIGRMIGVDTLHPHDFRHTGSQLLKLAGMPIEQISELLNHQGLDVTKKFYLRADTKKIQAEKDKYKI
jgi:site-specific recombinase XerD